MPDYSLTNRTLWRRHTTIHERPLSQYPSASATDDFDDYKDTGCPDQDHPNAQPSCLSCILPECRFEHHDLNYYTKLIRRQTAIGDHDG